MPRSRKPRGLPRVERLTIPFSADINALSFGQKSITAGDLGLDLNRSLRLQSISGTGTVVADSTCVLSGVVAIIADGQEGTVSSPIQFTHIPRKFNVRQQRIMDFGLVGSGASLAVITHTAPISASPLKNCSLYVTGVAVVEYLKSSAIHVVSLRKGYDDFEYIGENEHPCSSRGPT